MNYRLLGINENILEIEARRAHNCAVAVVHNREEALKKQGVWKNVSFNNGQWNYERKNKVEKAVNIVNQFVKLSRYHVTDNNVVTIAGWAS